MKKKKRNLYDEEKEKKTEHERNYFNESKVK